MSRFQDLIQIQNKNDLDQVYKGATAEHLFNSYIDSFKDCDININNIIGFGSDGCSTMMGINNSVSSRMKSNFPGVFIMKCICVVVKHVRFFLGDMKI